MNKENALKEVVYMKKFILIAIILCLFLVGCRPEIRTYGKAIAGTSIIGPAFNAGSQDIRDFPEQFLKVSAGTGNNPGTVTFDAQIMATSDYDNEIDTLRADLKTKMCTLIKGQGFRCVDTQGNAITGASITGFATAGQTDDLGQILTEGGADISAGLSIQETTCFIEANDGDTIYLAIADIPLTVTGAEGPITWIATGLPTWLSISNGNLVGTARIDSFEFTLTPIDGAGNSVSIPCAYEGYTAGLIAVEFSEIDFRGIPGEPQTDTIIFTGSGTDYTWVLVDGAFPTGMTGQVDTDSSIFRITGTPSEGFYEWTFEITDEYDFTVTQDFTKIVRRFEFVGDCDFTGTEGIFESDTIRITTWDPPWDVVPVPKEKEPQPHWGPVSPGPVGGPLDAGGGNGNGVGGTVTSGIYGLSYSMHQDPETGEGLLALSGEPAPGLP